MQRRYNMEHEEFYLYINQGLKGMGLSERAEDHPEKWEEHYQAFSSLPPETLDKVVREILETFRRGVLPNFN